MKKILALLFILFLGTSVCFAAGKKQKGSVVRMEIETKDGFVLVGDFYPSKVRDKKMPLVFMLHSVNGKSADWGDLPKKIAREGNNVFALDMRGHGRSVYNINFRYVSKSYLKPKMWLKFPNDTVETINFLKEHYSMIDYNHIIFVGADLGANTAILAGKSLKPEPDKMILISPAQKFKGLHTPLVLAEYQKTRFLLMTAETDRYFLLQAKTLDKFIQTQSTLKIYPNGGSGTLLLKQVKDATDDIMKFIYEAEKQPT